MVGTMSKTELLPKDFFYFHSLTSPMSQKKCDPPWIYKNTLLVPKFEDFSTNQYVQWSLPNMGSIQQPTNANVVVQILSILPVLTSLLFHAFLCLNEGHNRYNERRNSLVPVLTLTLLLIEPPHISFYVIYVIHIQRKYGLNLKTQILHSLNHANF